jgi:thiopurine S-methyltransferase
VDAHYWHARWREGRIGFHEGVTNRHLAAYWRGLELDDGASVLVPLCGKAVDMAELHRMGHRVVGAELSEIACRAFFDEQALPFDVIPGADHDVYRGIDAGAGITLWRGDFMTADIEAGLDSVFERAALIALARDERGPYVARLAGLLAPGARGLLVSISYPAGEKDGPPFSLPGEEIERLFGASFAIEAVSDQDVLKRERADERWGLSALREQVYRIERH